MKVLVTGAAGFIGSAVSHALVDRGDTVIGVDNLNESYDVSLKRARLQRLQDKNGFHFERKDIADTLAMRRIFETYRPDRVVNQAGYEGVKYSLENPYAYLESNMKGFLNILEGCRHFSVQHLVYASSSSVYGSNTKLPFTVTEAVDHPVSFYGVTKRANELMAHSYSHLFKLPTTGFRYFSVYGPWGRPDKALSKFTRCILEGKPILLYNNGDHRRDFTYIDDVVKGVLAALDKIPVHDVVWDPMAGTPDRSSAPFRIYNIGNHQPVEMNEVIEALEAILGKKAVLEALPKQPGEVLETFANVETLNEDTHVRPETPFKEGIQRFLNWYLDYYKVKI